MNASILIIAAFAVFALAIGVMARRGRKLTLEQWAVGGRGFGSLLTFLLMAGEAFSTFSFLGASGWTYSKGVPAFYILSYGCLAFVIGYWMLPAVWRYAKARARVVRRLLRGEVRQPRDRRAGVGRRGVRDGVAADDPVARSA